MTVSSSLPDFVLDDELRRRWLGEHVYSRRREWLEIVENRSDLHGLAGQYGAWSDHARRLILYRLGGDGTDPGKYYAWKMIKALRAAEFPSAMPERMDVEQRINLTVLLYDSLLYVLHRPAWRGFIPNRWTALRFVMVLLVLIFLLAVIRL